MHQYSQPCDTNPKILIKCFIYNWLYEWTHNTYIWNIWYIFHIYIYIIRWPPISSTNTLRHFCGHSNTVEMEKINKRALRMVFNNYTSPYEDLLVKIGRPMLYVMRLQAICIETFKAVNYLNPAFISKMFSRNNNEYDHRDSNKMIKPKVRTQLCGTNTLSLSGI